MLRKKKTEVLFSRPDNARIRNQFFARADFGTWFYRRDTWSRDVESSAAVLRFQSAL